MDETTKTMVDAASVATMLGTLGSILPPLAALFTIVWTGIRIYETETVQNLVKKIADGKDQSDD
jgi:hypothetical protein|tara:strand:+ start:2176 stop:2367 length:192 start_codon:yes stop_codon:yes gene_type:complete